MSTHFHKKPNMYTSHVQLKVSNLQNSVEFYSKIIGFKVLEEVEDTVYLTVDGVSSIVSLKEVKQGTPLRRGYTGLYHIALLLPTRNDMGNLIKNFIEHKVAVGTGDHHVSEALYLNDPDGNGIEMYIDRPEEQWLWNNNQVYMTTEEVDVASIVKESDGLWVGLPEDTVMGHVHLSVSDINQTREFYTEILDYEVVTEYGRQAIFVSTGGYHHHLAFNIWNGAGSVPAASSSVGLNSITIVLNDEKYANEVKNKLVVAGYPIVVGDDVPKHGGKAIFSTTDVNGFHIIFTVEGK